MIFGYVRVSTDDQANGSSPEEQERKCRAIAQLRNASTFDFQLYRDDDVSGSTPLGERPAGREMLQAVQQGDVIVASKLDRMFRNTLDALQMLQDFKQRGVELILADLSSEPVNGEGIGKLVFGLMSMFADFERERICLRTAEGRSAKARQNGHLGGLAPFGYRVEGQGRQARLIEEPREQETMTKVIALTERFSPAAVIRICERDNIRGRNDRVLTFMDVKRMVARHKRDADV